MRKILALIFVLALALAACSAGAGSTPAAAAPSVAAPSPSAMSSEGASPSGMASPSASAMASGSTGATGPAEVKVADSSLGKIVVDGQGRTLYLFTPDNQSKPTCYDSCAESWPPLLTQGAAKPGEGVDAGDFKTATRTDGGEQVTFYGWPLYYFGGDASAGDVNGQGIGGKWFVVSPEGQAIK